MIKPGYVDGKHYTEFVDEVRRLKRIGDLDQAEALLLRLVDATEAEARAEGLGVAPWYYEQPAIVYRKRKLLHPEIAILERYQCQSKAPGVGPSVLADRLERLRRRGR